MSTTKSIQLEEIRKLVAVEDRLKAENAGAIEKSKLQLQKWRLIHKHLHDRPFPTKNRLKRSDQWRDVANYVRDIAEVEVMDWVLLQAEVAFNIERGIRELRPRKNGPCHELLMEYVNNRKRKALAVHKWAASEGEENTATANTLTDAILRQHSTRGTGGTGNL